MDEQTKKLIIQNPRNESKTHYLLKCCSFVILRGLNCLYVVPEQRLTIDQNQLFKGRNTVDVLGYQKDYDNGGWISRAVECKASYEDFRSGFVTDGADYIYIASPKGVISSNEIPPKVGHIEIDFDAIEQYGVPPYGSYAHPLKIKYPCQESERWYIFSKRPQRIPLTDLQEQLKGPDLKEIGKRNTSEIQRMIQRSMRYTVKDLNGDTDA